MMMKQYQLMTIIQMCALLMHTNAFGSFQLPQIKLPWDTTSSSSITDETTNTNSIKDTLALQPGDTVAVIGASGNVGKLVSLRLADTYQVHGVVRDASSVVSFFKGPNEDKIKLFEIDLLEELQNCGLIDSSSSSSTDSTKELLSNMKCPESLQSALSKANALVICTGTTAFPTKAWSKNEQSEITSDVLSALFQSKLDISQTISTLDSMGLNTPNNIDAKSNQFLIQAWMDATSSSFPSKNIQRKRVVLLSSIGVQRRTDMPFPILNACGVLDAKAVAEESVKNGAEEFGYNYSIIRPGQLFGGPYDNNYYLGTLFQLDKDAATQDVEVGKGDTLLGDTLRSTLAEVTAQICETDTALNMDFAVVNVKGDVPSVEGIQGKLKSLI